MTLLLASSDLGLCQNNSKPATGANTATNLSEDLFPPMPPLPPGMAVPGEPFVVTRLRKNTNAVNARTTPPRTVSPQPVAPPVMNLPVPVPASVLAFDAERKDVELKAGEQKAHYVFYVTNVSSSNVLITALRPGCGCTAAKMPQQPWTLRPGQSGPVEADMNVHISQGMMVKPLTVETSAGNKLLYLAAKAAGPAPMPAPVQPGSVPATNSAPGAFNGGFFVPSLDGASGKR